MNPLFAWVKALPPGVQSLIYAVETGATTALVIFLGSLYTALGSPTGLDGFNWHGQLVTLELGVAAAVVKALLDFLKGAPPTQKGTP